MKLNAYLSTETLNCLVRAAEDERVGTPANEAVYDYDRVIDEIICYRDYKSEMSLNTIDWIFGELDWMYSRGSEALKNGEI